MMSKKKWFVILCIFIMYLLMGAGIFFTVQSEEEVKNFHAAREERQQIETLMAELLSKTAPPGKEKALFEKLSDYCGKPIMREMSAIPDIKRWDFYHSLFFVITVVSTIGYGNLAPTTMFGRIFMIFYGLVGIPLNGIVMVTLGMFFGRSFLKLYQRWKTAKMQEDTTHLGLISQIVLYAVPGFTFFIFLPAGIMVVFEGWAYDVAVYYCFVTLTTIGFGDYVAGVENVNEFSPWAHWVYKMFLLVWVIGGLGYVVMILGFITQGMQSKKMKAIEQIITTNIKKTPIKLRQELRSMLQEFLFTRVKTVYKDEAARSTPQRLGRSQSCPELTIYRNIDSPSMARKRALSECPRSFILNRIQSDTELELIDKDLTFKENQDLKQQQDLLLKLVDALALKTDDDNEPPQTNQFAYDGFSDEEILSSERYKSHWSLNSHTISAPVPQRRRAVSDIRIPTKLQTMEVPAWMSEDENTLVPKRGRTFSEPNSDTEKRSGNIFTKLKNIIIPSRDDSRTLDVERQDHHRRRSSMFTAAEENYLQRTRRGRASALSVQQQEAVLEQTSIADFLRAISAITVPESMRPSPRTPQRKLGTASLTPPKPSPPRTRRPAIRPNMMNLQARRSSLIPDTTTYPTVRRLSLRPVEENFSAPPPYSALPENPPARRYSRIFNLPSISVSTGPVQRQVNKKDKGDSVI